MDNANKAALDNSVTSPVDPKILKKNAEKAEKDEEDALKTKEEAAEKEEEAHKKLIEEGTAALKELKDADEKKTPTPAAGPPLDRDGKEIKCAAPADEAAEEPAKDEKKDDKEEKKEDAKEEAAKKKK